MLVSIIIPLYNYESYIKDCLKSCIKQTYENIEIIVVNDCSTDESAKSVEGFRDSRIRLISLKKNIGYSEAKNIAIKSCTGDAVVPIDADDMLTPESVEVRLNLLEKRPEIDFVHGLAYDVTDTNVNYEDCLENRFKLSKSPGTQRYLKKEHRKKVHAQGMMFRRCVFEKFGLYYNMRVKSDKEMTYRLGIHPESPLPKLVKSKRVNDFVAFYRRHESSLKTGDYKENKKMYNDIFGNRIKQLKKEGITKENTPCLNLK